MPIQITNARRPEAREMSLIRRVCSSFPQVIGGGFTKRSFKSSKLPEIPLESSQSSTLTNGIHVFHCPDEVGIVAKLSDCIASRGGNILAADVFVPHKKHVFYSRCEFVFDPAKWPRVQMDEDFLKLSTMFKAIKSIVRVPDLDPEYKIAVLASKQEHCLVDLLHGWQDGRLPVHISCVISNHDRGPNTHVMRFLERHKIPYHYLGITEEDKREEEILDLVQDSDFLVLARYMQVLSGNFLKSYGKDVINIHHGLLPSFKGGNPSKQAFVAGVKLIGATSHFVTEELDEGPIIEQMLESLASMVVGVSSNDNNLQVEATTQFRKLLSIERSPPIEEVIKSGVVPYFVEFLTKEDFPQLQFEAAWALTNIASRTSKNTKVVIDHGAVPIFVKIFKLLYG